MYHLLHFSVIRFRKENNSTIPTCGFITAGDNSYDHFECSDKKSSGWITLMIWLKLTEALILE